MPTGITVDGFTWKSLQDLMSFDHVIRVNPDGSVSDKLPNRREFWAPEVYWAGKGPIVEPGWTLLRSPWCDGVRPSNELIGGALESEILSAPGLYVAVEVKSLECEDHPDSEDGDQDDTCGCDMAAGWAIAFKDLGD